MGICRCNKRRVTQSFCFEHKVNVCEFCMVNTHQTCIVQPYLQWLEDCSYNAKCSFCQLNLSNEECVRLLCYHVFHWSCLNKYCSNLPVNTAPAGYTCPDCKIPIFPSNNTPSPIYTALKKKLSTVEWARIGLGLPISSNKATLNNIEQTKLDQLNKLDQSNKLENNNQEIIEKKKIYIHHDPPVKSNFNTQPISINNISSNYLNNHNNQPTIINNNNNLNNEYNTSFNQSITRNKFNLDTNYQTDRLILDIDDEHKYRQRSSFDRLLRYLKFFSYKHSLTSNQRAKILIIAAVLAFFLIFYLFAKLGRSYAENDPLNDPKFNPNIHLGNIQDLDNIN